MKTRSGLVEDFLTFEEENKLFATDYWAYLRLEIYRAIEGDVFGTGYSPVYFRQSVDFSSVRGECAQRDIVVIDNANRFVSADGFLFNPTTHAIIEDFPQEVFEISFDFNGGSIILHNGERARSFAHGSQRTTQFVLERDGLCDIICRTFGILDEARLRATVNGLFEYLAKIFALRTVFENLFGRISPRIAVFENAYNPMFVMLNDIAKSRGIVTVELQHGHFDRLHIAFNVRNEVRQSAKKWATDRLFVYGPYYKNCARHIRDSRDIIVTGNQFYEYIGSRYADRPKYDILFVSSTHFRPIREYAVQLKKIDDTFKILYRLHPEEKTDERMLSELVQLGIVIENPKSRNIYGAIAECRKVVAYNSTVIYEAAGIGKPVGVIVDEFNQTDAATERITTPIRNCDELVRFVRSETCGNIGAVEDFFAKGGRRLIVDVVNEYMHKGGEIRD